jgi:hypothetical protein
MGSNRLDVPNFAYGRFLLFYENQTGLESFCTNSFPALNYRRLTVVQVFGYLFLPRVRQSTFVQCRQKEMPSLKMGYKKEAKIDCENMNIL